MQQLLLNHHQYLLDICFEKVLIDLLPRFVFIFIEIIFRIFVCFSFELLMNFDRDWKKLKITGMAIVSNIGAIVKTMILLNNCENGAVQIFFLKIFLLYFCSLYCMKMFCLSYIKQITQEEKRIFFFSFVFFRCVCLWMLLSFNCL